MGAPHRGMRNGRRAGGDEGSSWKKDGKLVLRVLDWVQ
jgi:hypothetical protein